MTIEILNMLRNSDPFSKRAETGERYCSKRKATGKFGQMVDRG